MRKSFYISKQQLTTMITSKPQQITTFDQFNRELGKNYVIFCGSAISAFKKSADIYVRFLPFVGDVTQKFFSKLADSLENGSYLDKIVSEYSSSLSNGRLLKSRELIKFEAFLGLVEKERGRKNLCTLLEALFYWEIVNIHTTTELFQHCLLPIRPKHA